jgi:hypothetical protein
MRICGLQYEKLFPSSLSSLDIIFVMSVRKICCVLKRPTSLMVKDFLVLTIALIIGSSILLAEIEFK